MTDSKDATDDNVGSDGNTSLMVAINEEYPQKESAAVEKLIDIIPAAGHLHTLKILDLKIRNKKVV